MKLLFIHKRIGTGGIATGLVKRLNYLAENTNFEIHVLSEFSNDEKTIAKFNPKVNFHLLNIQNIVAKKRLPIIGYFHLIKEVKKGYQEFILTLNPDIITGFSFGYNSEVIPQLETTAIKIIELRGSYLSNRFLKKKKDCIDYFKKDIRKFHNGYDYAIILTKEDLLDRTYLKIPKKQIYNSIKLPQKINIFSKRDNIILAVGTLTHNKNFIDLIEAANLIKNKLENWQIHIYGEGVEKDLLQNKINDYGLNHIVKLKGFNYDMPSVYNNAKILISTSLSEGFGRTLTEALSYKTPVIAYDCKCGPKEIIRHEVNGYLIEFSPKVLSEKIDKLISDEHLLQSFSDNAWIDMDKFDYNNIMNQWVEFYNSIIKNEK